MPRATAQILTPTDDFDPGVQPRGNGFHHLMPHLRLGRMSAEEFAKARRERIPVDDDALDGKYDPSLIVKLSGRGKKAENAVSVSEAAKVHVGKAPKDRAKVDKKVREQAASKEAEAQKVTKARSRKKPRGGDAT